MTEHKAATNGAAKTSASTNSHEERATVILQIIERYGLNYERTGSWDGFATFLPVVKGQIERGESLGKVVDVDGRGDDLVVRGVESRQARQRLIGADDRRREEVGRTRTRGGSDAVRKRRVERQRSKRVVRYIERYERGQRKKISGEMGDLVARQVEHRERRQVREGVRQGGQAVVAQLKEPR